MLTTGIVVLIGVVVACYSPQLVDRYWVSCLPLCLYIAYINPQLRIIGLLLGSFLWATGFMHWQLDHRLSAEWNNKRLVVVGEVLNIPKQSQYSSSFVFRPIAIQGEPITEARQHRMNRVRLNWRDAPENLRPGQIWSLNLKLKQPHGFQNPGGFDYERWMFERKIQATGYVTRSQQNRLVGRNDLSINLQRHRIRQHLIEACQACRHSGLIQALAIGYRGDIGEQTQGLLQQTGTAHLIAVSGLHIGIVAALFYSIGLWLWRGRLYRWRLKRKELAMLVAWLAGLAYCLLSGFELPAQRAMLMLSIVLLTLLLRLPFNLLNSIMTALVLVLILSPLAVLSASFWLTFSALLIISFGSFLLQGERSRLKQLVVIQLLFSILFIPLSILIFGQVHSASMAANLIAVPLVSLVVVPLNFILLLLFWLPLPWLQFLYGLLDRLIGLLIDYLEWLQEHGLQAIAVSEIAPWKLFLLLVFGLILLLPKGLLSRSILLLALPPLLFWQTGKASARALEVTVLDVGMGTSIVIQTLNHSLVYDFGAGNRDGYSLGEWVVLPYLLRQGISRPDRIVISHADQDHAGGYYALEDDFKGVPIYSGTPKEFAEKFPDTPTAFDCHLSEGWIWDGVSFEFVTTRPSSSASENDRSCVLKVSLGAKSILIAGDIESRQEQALLRDRAGRLVADILVAPHHGSLSSSTSDFIAAVGARHVIFTTGFLNRWGFPRTDIVERYLASSSNVYQTDKTGAISIECNKLECQLQSYRQENPRIWY